MFIKIILSSFLLYFINTSQVSEEEITQTVSNSIITCGSTLRIQNVLTKYFLSSYSMAWSTGSRLQLVTAAKEQDKYESLFTIKEADNEPMCATGEPIKCDSIIRLEHVVTRRNLHTHPFKSFLDVGQEVCAFGEEGEGDVNDNFKLICYKNEGDIVKGKTQFFLYHMGTQKYLAINYRNSMFHDGNCRNCPINGQREVIGTDKKDKQCLWTVNGGILFSSQGEMDKKSDNKENNDDDSSNNKKDL
ncbi:MAG: hypothetical protein MJ252_15005 [archaeon]|nr:hypothetical protein [archaeon]